MATEVMPHKDLILKLCSPNGLLAFIVKTSPPVITIHEKEKLLDEMDALVRNRRMASDMASVHKLLEAAHFISRYHIVANLALATNRRTDQ